MKKLFMSFCFAVGLSSHLWASSPQPSFTILAEDLPPFIYTNKDLKESGIAIEIVKQLAQSLKHSDKIEIMNWNKAYNLIKNNSGYMLFPVSRRPNREALFKWVGPLLESTSYLYKRKEKPNEKILTLNSLEEAKNVSDIAVVKNYAGQKLLEEKGFQNLVPSNHTKDAIRALAYGRVQLAEIGDVFLPFRAKQADIDYRLLEKTNVELLKQFQYLAFSKDTPDSIIEQWQHQLDNMKANGTYDQIVNQEYHKALSAFGIEK